MSVRVKFCPNNCPEEIEQVKHHLKPYPDVEIVDDFCILYCGQCLVQPFALVNGKNIVGDTAEELFSNVVRFMNGLDQQQKR